MWDSNFGSSSKIELTTDAVGGVRTVQLSSSPVHSQDLDGIGSGNSGQQPAKLSANIQFDLVERGGHGVARAAFGHIAKRSLSIGDIRSPVDGVSEIHIVDVAGRSSKALHVLYDDALNAGRREEAQQVISGIIPGVSHIEIGLNADKQPRLVTVYPNRAVVPLELAGDGAQSLARISLELAARAGGVVLLEEPEVYLHPAAVRQTAKAIWAAVRREIQVILTTHSLELIDCLLSESADEEELEKLSVYRTQLKEGCLRVNRLSGSDAEFKRNDISDDLR